MAEFLVDGDVEPVRAVCQPRAVWPGSDVVVRLRVYRERIPETAPPSDYLTRSELTSVHYQVYRRVSEGLDELVLDLTEVNLATAVADDADLPVEWGADGEGYNVRFVVDGDYFQGNVQHTIVARVIAGGVTRYVPIFLEVQGPAGATTPSASVSTPATSTREMLFSQTETVTVENTGDNTTLVGAGQGTNLIPAASLRAGMKHVVEASGYFSTTAGDQSAIVQFVLGSEITLNFPILYLLGGLANERWNLRASITCRTTGATGSVVVDALLHVGGAVYQAGTTAAVTLDTTAGKTPECKLDWTTAHLGNSWKCQQFDLIPYGAAA